MNSHTIIYNFLNIFQIFLKNKIGFIYANLKKISIYFYKDIVKIFKNSSILKLLNKII